MAVLSALSVAAAQSPSEHEPGMTPQERLARPPMSDPPTQVELGHAEYWMSCMVCHGDRGQGLTEEWRTVLDPADMNCWQSRCHAPNHPPQGFEIPRTAPLVIGPGALTGYQTASDLFAFMRPKMPWSFPGLFEDDVYWNLTAYLADANGIDLPQEPLGPDNGDEVLMLPQLVQTHHTAIEVEQIVASAVVGLLLLAAILYWVIRAL
jgi:mono/diheme cytochrome c family protein